MAQQETQSAASSDTPLPSSDVEPHFDVVNATEEAEQNYDLLTHRHLEKPSGVVASCANIVKGALGAGVLGAHVGYSKAGIAVALTMNLIMGTYMTYCLYILVGSAQILCRRTARPSMSYADVGEASWACSSSPFLRKHCKWMRHCIDVIICIDLFGSCACYQLIISKTIKQLVENSLEQTAEGKGEGYPHLRIYLLIMLIPCVGISLIRHLDYIGKVAIFGNMLVFLCVIVTVYYSLSYNPTMGGMTMATDLIGLFTFMGMVVFSMSCAGIVIDIENNMREPQKFPYMLLCGMTFIVGCVVTVGVFGYSAWKEESDSPVTIHFPLETLPEVLKVAIAIMIYITYAINFFAPFSLVFHYIKKRHPAEKRVMFEYIYRAIFSTGITILAIIFPNVNKIMGFCGTFCLSNMAFIWPCTVYLLVNWERPGLGRYYWRLWKCVFLITFGLVLFFAGTAVTLSDLLSLFGIPDPFESSRSGN